MYLYIYMVKLKKKNDDSMGDFVRNRFFFQYGMKINQILPAITQTYFFFDGSELGTLEWDILNPDRLINMEINNKRRTSII